MINTETLSEIEKLKLLKSVRVANPDDNDFDKSIAEIFHLDAESLQYHSELASIKARLEGLLLEDEFSMLCRLMGTCSLISSIEQTPMPEKQAIAPDFLVNFDTSWGRELDIPNNLPFMIEVKTKQLKYKKTIITESHYSKRLNYAKAFRLPLLMATRISNALGQRIWIIQTESQFIRSERKPQIEDWHSSVGQYLLGEFLVSNTENIFVELKVHSSGFNSAESRLLPNAIESIQVSSNGRTLTLKGVDRSRFLLLDCFPQKELEETHQGEYIILKRLIRKETNITLSDLVLRSNEYILERDGTPFSSPSRLLAQQDNNSRVVTDKRWAMKLIEHFNTRVTHLELLKTPHHERIIEDLRSSTL